MGRWPMTEIDKRNLVAQWAFDTRPVLLRFHLWLEDVEVERVAGSSRSPTTRSRRAASRAAWP